MVLKENWVCWPVSADTLSGKEFLQLRSVIKVWRQMQRQTTFFLYVCNNKNLLLTLIVCSIWNVYRHERLHTSKAAVSSRWQCCVSLQSFLSRPELLSAARCPKTHDCITAVPRIRHIFLCYFHINSAAPTCLSFLSHSNLEYIAALSDTMLRLFLRVKAPLFFFFFHIFVVMKRFHRYFLTSSHISL